MASTGENEDIRRLRQEILQAQQGLEEEKRLREEAKRLREEAERYRELAQAELAPTALPAFLDACHIHLSMALNIPANPAFSTQGDPANADKKIRPDRIRLWEEFPAQQEAVWNDLMDADFVTEQHFISINQVKGLAWTMRSRSIGSELDLNIFERVTVEEPISSIIEQLYLNPNLRKVFNLKGQVKFENHANMLSPEALVERSMQQMNLSDGP